MFHVREREQSAYWQILRLNVFCALSMQRGNEKKKKRRKKFTFYKSMKMSSAYLWETALGR